MTKIVWDQLGSRYFESGIDRGVLYLPDGSGVPWNGITSLTEDFQGDVTNAYYMDGVKYLDSQKTGDFSATLKAISFPDEFLAFEGIYELGAGLFTDGQPIQTFSLSYRNRISSDTEPDLGYKIHVVTNLIALEDIPGFDTREEKPTVLQFSWRITGVPQTVTGYRPTMHAIFDSRYLHPQMLSELEDMLYGTDTTDPYLMPFSDLAAWGIDWHSIQIVDNGDGTWTATGPDEYITMLDSITFQITGVDAVYADANTYTVSSTTP
jgi:hypothetical protein